MKNLFKRFTAVIAAVLIFCISVVPSSVSADDVVYDELTLVNDYHWRFRSGTISSNLLTATSKIENFLQSSSYNSDDDFFTFYCQLASAFFSCSFDFSKFTKYTYNDSDYYFSFDLNGSYYPFSLISSSSSSISTFDYNSLSSPLALVDSSDVLFFRFDKSNPSDTVIYKTKFKRLNSYSSYSDILDFATSYTGWGIHNFLSVKLPSSFFYVGPSLPDSTDKLTFTGVRLGVDKKGFLEWLITEGKESVINSAGYSFTQKQLSLLVDVFDSYGNSLFWFHSSLIKTFALTQHSLKGTSALLSTLQELYRDYLDYKNSIEIVEITPDDSSKPHWRQDKTDNILVTDQEDDTTILSILREILRTLIYLPSSIRTSFSDLATNLVSIMYNWNRLFDNLDYLSPDINFDISEDVDRLIEAINNISANIPDTSVDVTITDDKQQELDDFFNGWSVDFDNKVKEKFPVTAQLGELFNDDFFEKCGIDCNGDGEVYSYYSENVYAVSEVSTVSELSASAPGSDQKLVSDFIGQFDSADVNFLNDANFSSSVPDWSITVGGKNCEVFSFKLYAKYRTQIHFIISFILWTVYLLSLYKSLPSIIGQVSDVVHGIEKM